MNGYLVLLHHTMDDLPVRLVSDKAEAVRIAKQLDFEPSPEIRDVYYTDCSTPVCITVVEFRHGEPVQKVFERTVGEV